MQLLQLTVSLN